MARDHTKLEVFKIADRLVVDVYELTRRLPPQERYGLQSQVRRAAISTPANIVEGSAHHSDRQYLRFLETSLGSACEARYLLQLCVRLEFLREGDCDDLLNRYTRTIKGLASLIARIGNDLAVKSQERADSRKPRAES